MRLRARLAKVEKSSFVDRSNFRKLTDEELIEDIRLRMEGVGIDWEEFKSDPRGSLERRFEGYPDEDGLLSAMLESASRLDCSDFEL